MDQLYDTEPGQPRVPLRATPEGYLIVQIAGGGGGGGSSVTNLTTAVSPTNVVVASDTGTDATIPLADVTNAGAMPPAAVQQLAVLGTASEADVGDFAAADHTHALLMTTDERTKLGALPAAADLTTSLAGKMANTLPAIQTAFNAGTAPEKAAFQSSVSDASANPIPVSFLFSGAATTAAPAASAALTRIGAISTLQITAGTGVINLTAQVQATNDSATAAGTASLWTTIATVNLTAPGTAALPLALAYVGLRINVIGLSGGTAAASVLPNQSPLGALGGNTVFNPALTGIPSPGPYVAYQSAIPVMTKPSGSIGNNGSLTLGTALPAIYSGCWMYCAAGDIYAGSPAGIYYCQMSSTTAGVLYQERLTSGDPYIPSTPTAWLTTGPGAYTSPNQVATPLVTLPIIGGSIGANGVMSYRAVYLRPSNANVDGLSITLGGATLSSNPTANQQWVGINKSLRNMGAQNRQIGLNNATNLQGDTGAYGNAPSYQTIDTSSNQNLILQGFCNPADYIILAGYDVAIQARG